MAVLHVQNLKFTYASEQRPTLFDINIEVQRGELLLLCGPSGCGKTTLLHHLKPHLEPRGAKTGKVVFDGVETLLLPEREAAAKIGLIMQKPENQIVTDTVRHELAFGLECLGFHPALIARRVAETVSYFGIEEVYNKKTSELSGGEKQLISIAAIMAMRPELLLLDEPASQLDPIAARNLYDILLRLNSELGITIILSEHRIDDVFSLAHRVAVMSDGKLLCVNAPKHTASFMAASSDEKIRAMLPIPSKIFVDISTLIPDTKSFTHIDGENLDDSVDIPVTVREVKPWFESLAKELILVPIMSEQNTTGKRDYKIRADRAGASENKGNFAVTADSLCFRFAKNSEDVINNLSINIKKGEILSVVGGNGAGKTTLLRLISGIIKPYSGKIRFFENTLKTAYLPQNPQSMFAFDTVLEDLLHIEGELSSGKRFLLSTGILTEHDYKISPILQNIIDKLGIEMILKKHPFDLSFGELQRAALGMLLLKTPDILLLDEPTKGIDTLTKKKTAELLKSLCNEGLTVVAVTHDIEFAAEYSQSCAMLFDGRIQNVETPADFFSGNMCYTTVAHRIAGNIFQKTVTCEEVKNDWIKHAIKS
jgi:energy-coupling factor transport system ATP-binding protein